MKAEILSQLSAACPWKDTLQLYDTVDSTNDLAKMLARTGAPQGTVLIADCQTGGRGRMGRQFVSQAGMGVYMSVILRPGCSPAQLMHLTCAVGTAMCDAVEDVTGLRPGIKWINDLVLDGRKVGGILTELSVDTATNLVDWAVVGIGINCLQNSSNFPESLHKIAGSLAMAAGKPVDRAALSAAMIQALWKLSSRLLTEKAILLDRYRKDCITLGKAITVHTAQGAYPAVARDVDADGSLVVTLPDGSIRTVSSGEVSIRSERGYI